MKFVEFLTRQKFRFDIGASLWVIINFSILIIGFSDKFARLLPFKSAYATYWAAVIFIPLGLLSIWTIGVILDKVKFQDNIASQSNKRNPLLNEINERLIRIEGELCHRGATVARVPSKDEVEGSIPSGGLNNKGDG